MFNRARGTAISTGPKVPVSARVQLPLRWPVTRRFLDRWPSCPARNAGGQNRFEFAADQFFDELSRPIAHLDLDRIKPIIEKLSSHLGFTL